MWGFLSRARSVLKAATSFYVHVPGNDKLPDSMLGACWQSPIFELKPPIAQQRKYVKDGEYICLQGEPLAALLGKRERQDFAAWRTDCLHPNRGCRVPLQLRWLPGGLVGALPGCQRG